MSRKDIKDKITKAPEFNLHLTPVHNLNQELAVEEIRRQRHKRRVSGLKIPQKDKLIEDECDTPSPLQRKRRLRKSDSFKNTPSRKLSPNKGQKENAKKSFKMVNQVKATSALFKEKLSLDLFAIKDDNLVNDQGLED